MSGEQVDALSLNAQGLLIATQEFQSAKRLALYAGIRTEVMTDYLFAESVRLGKEVCFPLVVNKQAPRIAFFRVTDSSELSPGIYDIPEPSTGGGEVAPGEFDLIVVPGVAFDKHGARLGYGKGYYDKALTGLKCPVAALAFDIQVLDVTIPCEPHDVKVDMVVTQTRVVRI